MSVKFYELAIGARFVFGGQRFEKTAMSMAADEQRVGCIFLGETAVVSEGPLLSAGEAGWWKPEGGPWAAVIEAMSTSCPADGHSRPGGAPARG